MTQPVSFATQSITRRRAEQIQDAYQNAVWDWPNAVDTDLAPGSWVVYPLPVDAQRDPAREALARRYQLVGPAGVDLIGTDRVVYLGVEYQIQGEVQQWQTGIEDHCELLMIEWTG